MSKLIVVLSAFLLTACGSAPTENHSEAASQPAEKASAPAAPAATEEDTSSRVLNKNKKCPKNTRMVNGKCVLQVESTE